MAGRRVTALRPIGTFYAADPTGRLPRAGQPPQPPWSEHAAAASRWLARELGADLVSVALRGSAARATAVEGSSDLDLVVVTRQPGPTAWPDYVPTMPGLKVELHATTEAELRDGPCEAWLRFSLAFSGCTVRGRDVVSELPDPVLGPHAIAHLKAIGRWLPRWRAMLTSSADAEERRAVCTWLMKRCVRSAFESVMLADGVYTRDIFPCAHVAAHHYPGSRSLIFDAAELAMAPVPDEEAIARVAEPMTELLAQAYQRQYGTTPPQVG
jgi:hypothetical protein